MDSFFLTIGIFTFVWFYRAPDMVVAEKVILDPDNPEESQKLSYVEPVLVNLPSYAGYINVSEKYGAHLFFWFFKSESSAADAPLIVWLQGQQGKWK